MSTNRIINQLHQHVITPCGYAELPSELIQRIITFLPTLHDMLMLSQTNNQNYQALRNLYEYFNRGGKQEVAQFKEYIESKKISHALYKEHTAIKDMRFYNQSPVLLYLYTTTFAPSVICLSIVFGIFIYKCCDLLLGEAKSAFAFLPRVTIALIPLILAIVPLVYSEYYKRLDKYIDTRVHELEHQLNTQLKLNENNLFPLNALNRM